MSGHRLGFRLDRRKSPDLVVDIADHVIITQCLVLCVHVVDVVALTGADPPAGKVKVESHPYYWIKKEIELRVKEGLNLITEDEVENTLGPIYEQKEKENEYAL